MTFTIICIFSVHFALFLPVLFAQCIPKLDHLNLSSAQYEGAWFRIAHMGPAVDYLPNDTDAALFKLIPQGRNLEMVEYYERNGTCSGPVHGIWMKQDGGFIVRVTSIHGITYSSAVKAIFHEYSGEDNQEMNMVLYGCRTVDSAGQCLQGEEMASILSNSRHPQTLTLFKSAKHLEDSACIDILRLKMLNTYSGCGDEIVDEDQKLANAQIDPEGELIEKECKAENFPKQKIGTFFEEPRMLTVTALIDPVIANEDISHISCLFRSPFEATCDWIRHQTCYKSELRQTFLDDYSIQSTTVLQLKNGTTINIDWSGTLLWHNGDEYIIYKCLDVNEDGTCDQYWIYVWSDKDLMDQPTIHTIYDQLDSMCADPADLIFLNTFRECNETSKLMEPPVRCGPLNGWSSVSVQLLQGVWFFAADVNAHPKIYLQSTVVELTQTDRNDTMNIRFYAQREADLHCIGPGDGTLQILAHNSTITVKVRYHYEMLPELRNRSIEWQNQVLYVDNQRLLLYWCFKRAVNGSCVQYDVDILVRSRHLAYHDMALLQPYLNMACVQQQHLRWFDLHSHCGFEMSQTSSLRRTIMTLTHREVLNILTNVQEPRCNITQITGLKVNLTAIEKFGKWFLMSRHDRAEYVTFGLIGRLKAVTSTSAVVKIYQSAARPGFDKKCFKRILTMIEHHDGDDYTYHLYFESLSGFKTFMIIRFLFLNGHVGVIYSCLAYKKTGHCENPLLYVLSAHDSIDHTELTVLERIANSVCFPAEHLVHASVYDECIYGNYNVKLGSSSCTNINLPPSLASSNRTAVFEELKRRFNKNTYFAIASSTANQTGFLLKFNNGRARKIRELKHRCTDEEVEVHGVGENAMMVVVNNQELVLLSAFGISSTLAIHAAQAINEYPCLFSIQYPELENLSLADLRRSRCALLLKQTCKPPRINLQPWQLNGEWVLYESLHRIVANIKCTISNTTTENRKNLVCQSESTSGICLFEESFSLATDHNGAYILELTDSIPRYLNSEIGISGTIISVTEKYFILYTACQTGCLLPNERRVSVWTKIGTTLYGHEVEPVLRNVCILEDELNKRTGDSECW